MRRLFLNPTSATALSKKESNVLEQKSPFISTSEFFLVLSLSFTYFLTLISAARKYFKMDTHDLAFSAIYGLIIVSLLTAFLFAFVALVAVRRQFQQINLC